MILKGREISQEDGHTFITFFQMGLQQMKVGIRIRKIQVRKKPLNQQKD